MTRQFLARRPIENLRRFNLPEQAVVARVEKTEKEAEYLLARQSGFLGRLFPDEIQRAKAAHELTQVKTELEGRQRILRLIVETHVEGFRETCNTMLMAAKADMRRWLSDYLTRQIILLKTEMENNQAEFQALLERKHKRIQTIPIPELRDAELALLHNLIFEFHDLLDQMVRRYKSIVTEFIDA